MQHADEAIKGRGAHWNPVNRFDEVGYAPDPDPVPDPEGEEASAPKTVYLEDRSKSILARNDSPDVGFDVGINPYRGCEHGCVYCYARPTHEYHGYSAGLDFETKILVKKSAPRLLRDALMRKSYEPECIAISGATDPYQPAEREFQLTRQCLEVLADFRNPCIIITKNRLVTRDIDILKEMAEWNGAAAFVSVTTLDLNLNRILEPRTSAPKQRLEAIAQLAEAGIPVGVMCAPVIPCITDHEMPKILEAASKAGARQAGYILMRLPFAVAPLFESWLEQHFPQRKEKVLNRVRELRGGKLNQSDYGQRMRGQGFYAEQMRSMFDVAVRKQGLNRERPAMNTGSFRRPGAEQLDLFG